MGANAQTTVPTFTAGQVLTAAQMNNSARTGVPVFANTTDRDAGFGGAGEKTLAEGQLAYVENLTGDAQIQYYDGSTWNSLGAAGLTLISATTIGSAVSTVTVSNAFSSTYDNYLITLEGGVASTNVGLRLTLGATATGYYFAGVFVQYTATTVGGQFSAGGVNWEIGYGSANALSAEIVLGSPNLAKVTTFRSRGADTGTSGYMNLYNGFLNNSTQYTAFTIATSVGTMTGGTIRVYGFRNS